MNGRLLRASGANHRAWFRRTGGTSEDWDGLPVVVGGRHATIAFPGARGRSPERLDAAMQRGRERGIAAMSCWTLRPDRALGVLLIARGFEWGWQPHWMAIDVASAGDGPVAHEVVEAHGDAPRELPYGGGRVPAAARHFAVVEGERMVGHVVVSPWRGIAGIYDMGVADDRRRRGIGLALTRAACTKARELGCTYAVLNATAEGEPLYRRAGFESLGLGQTWWLHPGRRPTARQTSLVEAIGFADLDRLAELRPTRAELEKPIPGAGVPLAVAVVASQPKAVDWILDRRPDLVSKPLEPRGGTLLHCAVEWDSEPLVRVALEHGADIDVRDGMWNGTPLRWAEHLGRPALAELLRREKP